MFLSATQIREGNIVLFKNELHRVVSTKHLTPGNWRGMVFAKLKNLKTGSSFEQRFRSEEKVEKVHVEPCEMEFLYNDGEFFHFMNTRNYEQLSLTKEVVGEAASFLLPNTKVVMEMYNGSPVDFELPLTVDLKVTETDPSLKGATVTNTLKPAKLETGLQLQVPQFIQIGDTIRVDTHEGKYLERAK